MVATERSLGEPVILPMKAFWSHDVPVASAVQAVWPPARSECNAFATAWQNQNHLIPVQFGVIVVCNLIIGLVTPPVGTTLFVARSVGGVKMSAMIPHVLRFLGIMIVVLLLVTFVPAFSLWLPGFLD